MRRAFAKPMLYYPQALAHELSRSCEVQVSAQSKDSSPMLPQEPSSYNKSITFKQQVYNRKSLQAMEEFFTEKVARKILFFKKLLRLLASKNAVHY